jgi:SOS-response transcriptional repressor LexA
MLTAREAQVFQIYEDAALAGRPSPTMRELAKIADFSSASNAHRVVSQLVSKGFLRRMRYRTRADPSNWIRRGRSPPVTFQKRSGRMPNRRKADGVGRIFHARLLEALEAGRMTETQLCARLHCSTGPIASAVAPLISAGKILHERGRG